MTCTLRLTHSGQPCGSWMRAPAGSTPTPRANCWLATSSKGSSVATGTLKPCAMVRWSTSSRKPQRGRLEGLEGGKPGLGAELVGLAAALHTTGRGFILALVKRRLHRSEVRYGAQALSASSAQHAAAWTRSWIA